jgi:uncharacterized protein (DUF488 family)
MTGDLRVMTIGHSTRTADEFVALLQAHGVKLVADIRTIPRSRRHPHFSKEALAVFLPEHGVAYEHFPGLGGLRKPRAGSPNGGWRHAGFRGYADYMSSSEFRDALDALMTVARTRLTAIMCAESKWWQCHRQLVADALVARGVEVRHIMSAREAPQHELTAFARIRGDSVDYPALV